MGELSKKKVADFPLNLDIGKNNTVLLPVLCEIRDILDKIYQELHYKRLNCKLHKEKGNENNNYTVTFS